LSQQIWHECSLETITLINTDLHVIRIELMLKNNTFEWLRVKLAMQRVNQLAARSNNNG
jgi:hypothetical protein